MSELPRTINSNSLGDNLTHHFHAQLTAHWLPLINRQTNNTADMTSR